MSLDPRNPGSLITFALLAAACRTAPAPAPPVAPEKPVEPEPIRSVQTATPQELTFPDEEFRTQQPVAGAPRPFRLPKMKPFTLKNGIKVFLVEQHTLPLVSFDLSWDG